VAADADIPVAARRVAWAKLFNAGQTCIAPDYVLVHRAVRDRFVEHLGAAIEAMTGGADLPLIDERQARRMRELLEGAGGQVVRGGRIDVPGRRADLTVVLDPRDDSPLMREEIFGPILPVLQVDSADDAVARVNRGGKPLALYVFSGSRTTARTVLAHTSSGSAVINHLILQLLVNGTPFGGVGASAPVPTTAGGDSRPSATARPCCANPPGPTRPSRIRPTARSSGSRCAGCSDDDPIHAPRTLAGRSMTMTTLPAGWQAEGIRPVGYCDLDGRPGFKVTITEVDGRWYLYLGHFWHSGWSIVDVTDPAAPELLAFVPGPDNTATLQVDLHSSLLVTALEKHIPGFGGDQDAPYDEGVLFWSLDDPARPRRLGHFRTGGSGTHRNGYVGGRYVHLAANMAGYAGNIYVVVDIADPVHPVEAGRWWVPGQHVAGGERPAKHGISLHGPPVPAGDLVYLPYGSAGCVVLDISDVAAPREVGTLSFSPPFRLQFGVHSVVLHPDRSLAYLNSEGVVEPRGSVPDFFHGHDHVSVVDITDPAHLDMVALFPRPVPPPGAGYRDFLDRPGWSGPHNQSQLHHNPDVAPQDDLVYLTYFNAGLRIYDVREPRQPTEVAWFLPPDPTSRYGPLPTSELVVQTEDVLVDRRGFSYLTDKHQGVWIVTADTPTIS
jgi:hypothetical protein